MKTTQSHGPGGFTLVEIMIVIAIIGLLAVIAIPNYVRARSQAQASSCISNLRQIDSAVFQLAIEKGLSTGVTITYPDDLVPYIKLNNASSIPPCPAFGVYSLNTVGSTPQSFCSLSTLTPSHSLQ